MFLAAWLKSNEHLQFLQICSEMSACQENVSIDIFAVNVEISQYR